MSDNVKQESVEILQTKEQETETDKSSAEAVNEKAAKKALKEKKKKEKQPADPAKKKNAERSFSLW